MTLDDVAVSSPMLALALDPIIDAAFAGKPTEVETTSSRRVAAPIPPESSPPPSARPRCCTRPALD